MLAALAVEELGLLILRLGFDPFHLIGGEIMPNTRITNVNGKPGQRLYFNLKVMIIKRLMNFIFYR
jgi:hypothetical protein